MEPSIVLPLKRGGRSYHPDMASMTINDIHKGVGEY